jgi:predicted dinucleotide-binding enzyme
VKIGIIGAGKIGGTLAARLVASGHDVALANSRGPSTLAQVAQDTGARAVGVSEVAIAADAVIVSIPLRALPELDPSHVAGVSVVIDTMNYAPVRRDPRIAELDEGEVESMRVQRLLGRDVVKAFNTINVPSLRDLGRAPGSRNRIALPVAGDSSNSVDVALSLVDAAGFDAVASGPLDQSWRQQPGTPAFCTNLPADDLQLALDQASLADIEAWRSHIATLPPV